MGVTACSNPSPSPSPAAAPAIGIAASLTGQAAIPAGPVMQAATVAVDAANAARVSSAKPVTLVTADDGGSPDKALAACQRLAGRGVIAIVGAQDAPDRAACAQAASANRIPYIAVGPAGAGECYSGAFFVGMTTGQPASAIASFLHGQGLGQRAFIVESTGAASQAISAAFGQAIASVGGAVLSKQVVSDATLDYGDVLAAIAAARPDVVVDSLSGAGAVAFQEQAAADPAVRALPRAGAGVDPAEAARAGPAFEGVLVAGDYLTSDPAPENQAWLRSLVGRYGDGAVPTAAGAETDDAVLLVLAASAHAASGDPAAIGDALTQVSVTGPRGAVQIKPGGHGHATLVAHVGKVGAGRAIAQVAATPPLDPMTACS